MDPWAIPSELDGLVASATAAPELQLLLDYDGTLVPLALRPDLATPDRELVALLLALAARRGTHVDVISGRTQRSIDRWLGHLPIGLHAEHGLWNRPSGRGWSMLPARTGDWRDRARQLLDGWTRRTPGSLTEEKTIGFAWHYRAADRALGLARANELVLRLAFELEGEPVDVLHGDMVVELRPQGINKGTAVPATAPGTLVVAIGDDLTDEDLFAALPEGSVTVAVGDALPEAQLRLGGYRAVRELLARIAAH